MIQTEVVGESKHILCSVTFFNNRAFYWITWKTFVQRGMPQMTI